MMEQHMKAMHGDVDPQMVARHREMMEKNCAPPSGSKWRRRRRARCHLSLRMRRAPFRTTAAIMAPMTKSG